MSKNVAVFVDVANIFYAAKSAGVDIDYVTLLKASTAGRDLVRAYAYTGLDPDNENQRNFHDFLRRHGYKVVSKDIRKYGDGRVKANLDIELVVDMMKTARNLDIAIVISGDGDFAPAIRAVQEMGVRVEVISFRGNTSSDLMDVADQFTDITAIAKVEKASTRSGRRVADDEADLSMTEVPDKQSEGATERRRRRTRTEGVTASRSSATRSSATRERIAPATPIESRAGLVALPGEKLSKGSAAAEEPAEEPAEESAAAIDRSADGDDSSELDEANRSRRRRRRGGRGRGRGRSQDELAADGEVIDGEVGDGEVGDGTPAEVATAAVLASADDLAEDDLEADQAIEAAPARPRPPRPSFGSVWDAQIGLPERPALNLGPSAPLDDDADLEEPEIPEYLLTERRQQGRGSGSRQARGGHSAYQAAVARERYGRGGVSRVPEPRAPLRDPNRAGGGGGREGGGRDGGFRGRPPERSGPRPVRERSSSEPWSEVPPEMEELLRAQLAARRSEPPKSAGTASPIVEAQPEADAAEATPKRRTTRRPASEPVTQSAVPNTAEAGTPKPRAARRRSTATADAPEAMATAEPAESAAPKRRTTRRPATTASEAAAAPVDGTDVADAAPKRRSTRRASKAPAGEVGASAEAAAPKRRTTRRKAADSD